MDKSTWPRPTWGNATAWSTLSSHCKPLELKPPVYLLSHVQRPRRSRTPGRLKAERSGAVRCAEEQKSSLDPISRWAEEATRPGRRGRCGVGGFVLFVTQ